MIRILNLSAAALLLCIAAPAPAVEEPDPAALAAAHALLATSDFEGRMEQSARLSTQATFDTIMATLERQLDRDVPPALEARLRRIVTDHSDSLIAAIRPTARNDAARIYARYFTAPELEELTRLQANPVLVKMQRISPQMMTELSQIGMAAAAERMLQLQTELAAAVEAWRAENRGSAPAPVT